MKFKKKYCQGGGRAPQQHEKYLGLPPIIGRSHKKAFSEIKVKL